MTGRSLNLISPALDHRGRRSPHELRTRPPRMAAPVDTSRAGRAVVLVALAHATLAVALLRPSTLAGERGGEIAIHGIAVSCTAAVAFLYAFGARNVTTYWPTTVWQRRSLWLSVACAYFGLVMGLAAGNPFRYVVGDSGQWAIYPIAWCLGYAAVRSDEQVLRSLKVLALVLTAQQARELVAVFTELSAGKIGRLHSVYWPHGVVAFVIAWAAALSSSAVSAQVAWLGVVLLNCFVGLASGFRTSLFLFPLTAIVVTACVSHRSGRWLRLSGVVVLITLAVLGGLVPSKLIKVIDSPISAAMTRLSELEAGGDRSSTQRLVEARLVIEKLSERPWNLPLGFGSGAMVSTEGAENDVSERYRYVDEFHYVHISPFSVLLRSGLLGLLALASVLVTTVWTQVRACRASRRVGDAALLGTLLVFLLAAPFFTFVPGDIMFAILAGMAGRRAVEIGTDQFDGGQEEVSALAVGRTSLMPRSHR